MSVSSPSGYWYDSWQFVFRSGYLTEVNWINDSKFSLTFINRLQTRFTILLCEITRDLSSSVCSKASGSLLWVLQKSPRIIYLISLCACSWVIKMVWMRILRISNLLRHHHPFLLTKTNPCIFLSRSQETKFWWRISKTTAATISVRLSCFLIILWKSAT